MNGLKSALADFAVCSLIGGILELLVSDKKAAFMRCVVTAVIISATVYSLAQTDFSHLISDGLSESLNVSYEETSGDTAALFEKRIYSEIEEILISYGINEYEIYVNISYEQTTAAFTLEKIEVHIPARFFDKITEPESLLRERYGAVTVKTKDNE